MEREQLIQEYSFKIPRQIIKPSGAVHHYDAPSPRDALTLSERDLEHVLNLSLFYDDLNDQEGTSELAKLDHWRHISSDEPQDNHNCEQSYAYASNSFCIDQNCSPSSLQ